MGTETAQRADLKKMNVVRSLILEKFLRDCQPERILRLPDAVETGFCLPSRRFYLIRSSFLDPQDSTALDSPEAQLPYTYPALLSSTLEIVLGTLNTDRFTTFGCMSNEDPYFLICLAKDVDPQTDSERWQVQEELRQLCTKAQKKVWRTYELHLQMWASDLIDDIDDLRTEFRAMDNEDLSPLSEKPVMFPADMAPYLLSPDGIEGRQIQELEQRAILAAIEHNWPECYDAFHQLIGHEQKHFPLCNHIHDRAIERLTEVFCVGGVPMNNAMIPSLCSHVWRKSLQAAMSPEDVDAIVKEVLLTCGELFHPVVSVSARVPEIVKFVEEHLYDPNLCADLVCSQFDISLSYLSRIFKENQHIKFIDYIHEKRVRASKKILMETRPSLTIQAVAERVGYTSALTYTRAFKRFEGMTPGAYRRLRGENREAVS